MFFFVLDILIVACLFLFLNCLLSVLYCTYSVTAINENLFISVHIWESEGGSLFLYFIIFKTIFFLFFKLLDYKFSIPYMFKPYYSLFLLCGPFFSLFVIFLADYSLFCKPQSTSYHMNRYQRNLFSLSTIYVLSKLKLHFIDLVRSNRFF